MIFSFRFLPLILFLLAAFIGLETSLDDREGVKQCGFHNVPISLATSLCLPFYLKKTHYNKYKVQKTKDHGPKTSPKRSIFSYGGLALASGRLPEDEKFLESANDPGKLKPIGEDNYITSA